MLRPFYISMYTFVLVSAYYSGKFLEGTIILALGIAFLTLIPVITKGKKKNAIKLIKDAIEKSKTEIIIPFININDSPVYVLEELPGINTVLAKRIVWYRNRYGKFNSVEDFFEKMEISSEHINQLKNMLFVE